MPSVVLIGGGFIGLEVAAALNARGCIVTVVEKATCLLPRVRCDAVSAVVLEHHRRAGIDVRVGTEVVSGGDDYVLLDDGGRVDADFIVAGIGIVPEAQIATSAGLGVDDGIVVYECCRTSDPDIFAAGDVSRGNHLLLRTSVRLESWQNANIQAQAVANAILNAAPAEPETPWAWSDQGELNVQVAGAPSNIDRVFIRRDPDNPDALTAPQIFQSKLVGACTVNNGKDMAIIRRLLAGGGELGLFAE